MFFDRRIKNFPVRFYNNNNNNKTNIYTGYTLQQVKTAVINVCPVP